MDGFNTKFITAIKTKYNHKTKTYEVDAIESTPENANVGGMLASGYIVTDNYSNAIHGIQNDTLGYKLNDAKKAVLIKWLEEKIAS